MKLKICGLKYLDNIKKVAEYSPDYIGFIFYEHSKRYAGQELDRTGLNNIDSRIKTTNFSNNNKMKSFGRTQSWSFRSFDPISFCQTCPGFENSCIAWVGRQTKVKLRSSSMRCFIGFATSIRLRSLK